MALMTGSRFFAEAMQVYGVTHVFFVPTMLLPALAEMEDMNIRRVTTHGEKAAAYMADGYARASHRPGICMAQTIGAANLAAGLRDAYMACSPVIAITGGQQPETKYRHVYQEIDDFPLFNVVTKFNAQVDKVTRLPDLRRQAFRAATSGAPGPVHLEMRGSHGHVVEEEGELELIVEDNGGGPTPSIREHLFDPFYSGRSAGRGRGMGLPTAWRFARQQGGDVRFDGVHDGVTRFVLTLPLAPVTALTAYANGNGNGRNGTHSPAEANVK